MDRFQEIFTGESDLAALELHDWAESLGSVSLEAEDDTGIEPRYV